MGAKKKSLPRSFIRVCGSYPKCPSSTRARCKADGDARAEADGGGQVSGTNTRVPEEEELMVINIDSSEQSRARLQLQLTPRYAGSASPDLWGQAPPHLTSWGGLRLA